MILLPYLAKASIVVLAAVALLVCAGRRSSAAFRHLICALAIGGLLILPIASSVLPAWTLSRPAATFALRASVAKEAGRHVPSGPAATFALRASLAGEAGHHVPTTWVWMILYFAGVLLLMTRLVVDHVEAQRLIRRATPLHDDAWQTLFRECAEALGVATDVRLLRGIGRATPMTTGIRHKAIVVPPMADGWSDEMRRAVLLHELAHVARRDCLTQTAAAFACALYWVHPGVWWLARRLRIERELACDDLVVLAGTDAHDYASHLLEVARTLRDRFAPVLAVGMASPGQVETRMLALMDAARNRTAPTRFARHVAIASAAVVVLPIAAATAVRAQTAGDATPAAQAQTAGGVRSKWVSRFLTVDYWRRAAAEGLSRLADQANYLSEMRQLGYSVTDADVIFRLRQHGVTPDFVRGLAAEGLSGLSPDDLLEAMSHGITSEYVGDLRGLGYSGLDLEALTRMRSHGIDGEFIRDTRSFGYQWSIDALVEARSHGIDPDFVLALSSLGYERLTLDDLIKLRSHGVTPMRIRSANLRANGRLSVDELAALASHGWKL